MVKLWKKVNQDLCIGFVTCLKNNSLEAISIINVLSNLKKNYPSLLQKFIQIT